MSDESVRFDLHVHTLRSPDSRADVKEILQQARTLGLRGIAITDHNTCAALRDVMWLEKRYDLIVVPGIEVTAVEGHILGLGITNEVKRGKASEVLDEITDMGGLAVVPHPYRPVSGIGPEVVRRLRPRFVETLNARSSSLGNTLAGRLAEQIGAVSIGGSDAHSLPQIGLAYTLFTSDVYNWNDVLELLRKGECTPVGRGLTPLSALAGAFRITAEWFGRRGHRI